MYCVLAEVDGERVVVWDPDPMKTWYCYLMLRGPKQYAWRDDPKNLTGNFYTVDQFLLRGIETALPSN